MGVIVGCLCTTRYGYEYMHRDLLKLNACRQLHPEPISQNCKGLQLKLHVCLSAWSAMLECHQDARFRQYILDGIVRGF